MRFSRVFAFLIAFASPAMGQGSPHPAIADSSPARIMARVGSTAEAPWLRNILRQSGANYSRAKLDEIADSLVARAIDPRAAVPEADAHTHAIAAINALTNADRVGTAPGRPYPAALDRLITVHQHASERGIRAHALAGMLAVSDRSRAIDYLRTVAESTDVTAYDAVEALVADANGSGWAGEKPTPSEQQATIAALNALGARHRVTDQGTRTLLEVWIENHRSNGPAK